MWNDQMDKKFDINKINPWKNEYKFCPAPIEM